MFTCLPTETWEILLQDQWLTRKLFFFFFLRGGGIACSGINVQMIYLTPFVNWLILDLMFSYYNVLLPTATTVIAVTEDLLINLRNKELVIL